MDFNFEIAFYVLSAVFIILIVFVLWILDRIMKRRAHEHETFEQTLRALGEAVTVLDEFALEEHRTMDSMANSGLSSHPAVRNARLRGLEDYRNSYVAKHQWKLRDALATYNDNAEELLGALGYDVREVNGMKVATKDPS